MGIEEEFGSSTPRRTRSRSASRSCATPPLARTGARRVDRRRADLVGDRDPLGPRREPRRRRCPPALRAAPGCSAAPPSRASLLAATGTHPWAPTQDQRIIDTEHYRRVEEGLKYVAWRNNTFSVHVHVGIRGADRAVASATACGRCCRSCWRSRPTRRSLDGRDSGLHSARTQIFTKSFPRCGIPEPFGTCAAYRDYVDFLVRDQLDRGAHAALVVACGRTTPSARWRCASATRSPTGPESERARRA